MIEQGGGVRGAPMARGGAYNLKGWRERERERGRERVGEVWERVRVSLLFIKS